MNQQTFKHWTKISLRTLHLLAFTGVGGGILFGLDQELWRSYWWLALPVLDIYCSARRRHETV